MPDFARIDGLWGSVIIPSQTSSGGATGSTSGGGSSGGGSDASAKSKQVEMARLIPTSGIGPVNREYDPELAAVFAAEL